jgi:hypothetical protein
MEHVGHSGDFEWMPIEVHGAVEGECELGEDGCSAWKKLKNAHDHLRPALTEALLQRDAARAELEEVKTALREMVTQAEIYLDQRRDAMAKLETERKAHEETREDRNNWAVRATDLSIEVGRLRVIAYREYTAKLEKVARLVMVGRFQDAFTAIAVLGLDQRIGKPGKDPSPPDPSPKQDDRCPCEGCERTSDYETCREAALDGVSLCDPYIVWRASKTPCKKCGELPVWYRGDEFDCEKCNPDSPWTKKKPAQWLAENEVK